jgi:hypothetical protein
MREYRDNYGDPSAEDRRMARLDNELPRSGSAVGLTVLFLVAMLACLVVGGALGAIATFIGALIW